jgi:hypothetical protein
VVAIGPVLALAGRADTPSAAGVTTTEASAQKLRLSKESRGVIGESPGSRSSVVDSPVVWSRRPEPNDRARRAAQALVEEGSGCSSAGWLAQCTRIQDGILRVLGMIRRRCSGILVGIRFVAVRIRRRWGAVRLFALCHCVVLPCQ